MQKLEHAIKQLEQDIMQNKQAIYLQYEYTKAQVINKLTSPTFLLLAVATGGLLSRPIKRQLKRYGKQLVNTRAKVSLLQKLITLSSEVSVAVKLFNRLKPVITRAAKKTHPHPTTVTH